MQKKIKDDTIYRQAAIDAAHRNYDTILDFKSDGRTVADSFEDIINALPSAQPKRTWYPVTEPPNHHNDVIVRGIEAIGNVTVHKIMQWDADTWRPTDYAPSIMWKEWSEI